MWIIYYKPTCPYSREALKLLKQYKENYQAIDVTHNKVDVVKTLQAKNIIQKIKNPSQVTVPICIRKGVYIGGCQELKCVLNKKLCNLFQ